MLQYYKQNVACFSYKQHFHKQQQAKISFELISFRYQKVLKQKNKHYKRKNKHK